MIERSACPTCGSCSGMFTANSMNCLTEALGLSLPGNGSTLATHADRKRLFVEAGHLIVDLARRYYEQDDESVLPRSIASRQAFENAMTLDIAMGGSTNTVLHILAAATKAASTSPWTTSTSCRARAGAVQGRAGQERRAHGGRAPRRRHHGDPRRARPRRPASTATSRPSIRRPSARRSTSGTSRAPTAPEVREFFMAAPGGVPTQVAFSQDRRWAELDLDREDGRHPHRRASVLQGWRARRAQGQHRARRLRREDGRRRRKHPEVHRPGKGVRKPGRGGEGHPRQRGQGRRRRGHPLRGTARRAGHAGNALSDQLSEVERARQRPARCSPTGASPAARPACRSAMSRRKRRKAARSAWCARATSSRSTSPTAPSGLAVDEAELARPPCRAGRGKGWKPVEKRKRNVTTALRAYAAFATSAAKGAVRIVPE